MDEQLPPILSHRIVHIHNCISKSNRISDGRPPPRSLTGSFKSCLEASHKSVSPHFFSKVATVGIQIFQYCLDRRITSHVLGVETWLRDLGRQRTGQHSFFYFIRCRLDFSCANWRFIQRAGRQADHDYENRSLFANDSMGRMDLLVGKTDSDVEERATQ